MVRDRLRIGLTTRRTDAVGYDEPRDALARDWARFMATALPECLWLPIPNLGADATVAYIRDWRLQGLILTGGADLGEYPLRDETELALLHHALAVRMPVAGICRGLQLMQHVLGETLSACSADQHVARRHPVRFTHHVPVAALRGRRVTVNSYHCFGIRSGTLASELDPVATTTDGWVEAARVGPALGLMWHPEREAAWTDAGHLLLRTHFGLPTPTPDISARSYA